MRGILHLASTYWGETFGHGQNGLSGLLKTPFSLHSLRDFVGNALYIQVVKIAIEIEY
jgi:hypothetical protein